MESEDDRRALLDAESHAAWFRKHPGAKDDGAVVSLHVSPDGRVTRTRHVGGVAEPIDDAEYAARAWWAEQQKGR